MKKLLKPNLNENEHLNDEEWFEKILGKWERTNIGVQNWDI